jgi:predicted TIM-barrel enzyme
LAVARERAFPPNARRRAASTIYNSGRYRMAGRGSLAGVLAHGNANEIVRDMAREVLPVVKHRPVLAGVNGTDPFCLFDPFLDDLKRLGFSGVQNFQPVGLIDGILRANSEETGMSYALEVEMIALARAKDILATPYIFSIEDAQAMAKAGADVIVCHLGLTAGGTIGAHTGRKLEECPKLVDEWTGAALDVNPEAIILVHGGPVAEPQDTEFILRSTERCHGFDGASSMEHLPTERAMTDQTRRFKAVAFEKASL